MPRYAGRYNPRKPIEQIYNEYRTHFTTDAYGKWPNSYRNQIEHHKIESSPRNTKPEYKNGNHTELNRLYDELKERSQTEKENNIPRLTDSETDINSIVETIVERIESLREFSEQETPRQLPTMEFGDKTYFVDTRLWQLRNVENPHDFIDLRELEYGSGDQLAAGAPERKEQQHEIQPDKTIEIKAEQDKVETSPKTEPHQEITEKPTELSYEKLGSPDYQELERANFMEHRPADISIRRRPGFDPLETGW